MRRSPGVERACWAAAVAALSITVWMGAAAAQAPDPALVRARGAIAELKAARGGVLGMGPAAELKDYLQWLSAPEVDALLDQALKARPHPLARTILERDRALQALRRGDRSRADALIAEQGFVTDWQVVGPFPNEGMSGLAEPYPPEEGLDLEATLTTRVGDSRWHRQRHMDHLGWVDLEATIRPIEASAAYAACVVEVPRTMDVTVRVGASAAYTLWLDGARVGTMSDAPGGEFDRDAWQIKKLTRGAHVILVKLANESGPLGFSLRLTDGRGAPLGGLKVSADPAAIRAALPKASGDRMFTDASVEGAQEVQPPLLAYLEAAKAIQEDRSQERGVAFARAAALANLYRPEDRGEPALEFIRSARQEAAVPEVLQRVSVLYAQQWQRHVAIDKAWTLARKDPWIRFRRSQITYSATGDASRQEAAQMVKALIEEHPTFVAPRLLRLEMLLDEGLLQTAWSEAAALAKQHPKHAQALQMAIRAGEELPTVAARLQLFAQRLAVNAEDIALYGAYTGLLLQAGRDAEARALVQKALKVRPDVTGFWLLAADVEIALGDHDKAEATLKRLTALVPGDPSYWSRLGMFQVELGRREAAIASLQRALELEPQNVPLKEYLDYLEPQAPGVDETFAMEVEPLDEATEQARYASEDLYHLLDQKVTQVYPNGLSSTFIQQVVKVRTDQGAQAMRSIYIPYTPGDEVVDVRQVRVTRPDGTVRETYLSGEESMSEPWYNLYYDYRAQVLSFPELSAGDVLEVRYSVNQTTSTNIFGDYFGDLWFVQDDTPKVTARYVLLTPKSRQFEIRAPKLPASVETREVESSDGPLTARLWTFDQVPGIQGEPGAPGFSELSDYIHVSTYRTWDDLTDWYWNLIKDQFVVDSELRKIVKELTAGLTDDRAKVAAIHNYVVKKTRYVALEFGIHGYKPYRTTLCFRRRFGDCKDKASLLKVMFEEAGVDANIVLVRTRNNGAVDDQPASLKIFDHAITYVPKFDLFLDGTAEYSGTTELPWGDQGVQVLIVQDGGGYTFTRTPISDATDNALDTTMTVDLTALPDGAASARAETVVTGQFAAGYRRQFQTVESRKEAFGRSLAADFPGARATEITFSDLSDLEAPVKLAYRFTGARLAETTGATIRFLPSLREANLAPRLASRTNRTQDLIVGYPYQDVERYTVRLPPGYKATLPRNVALKSPFGRFELQMSQRGQEVAVVMTLAVTTHRVAASDYAAFRQWLESVDAALATPITATKP